MRVSSAVNRVAWQGGTLLVNFSLALPQVPLVCLPSCQVRERLGNRDGLPVAPSAPRTDPSRTCPLLISIYFAIPQTERRRGSISRLRHDSQNSPRGRLVRAHATPQYQIPPSAAAACWQPHLDFLADPRPQPAAHAPLLRELPHARPHPPARLATPPSRHGHGSRPQHMSFVACRRTPVQSILRLPVPPWHWRSGPGLGGWHHTTQKPQPGIVVPRITRMHACCLLPRAKIRRLLPLTEPHKRSSVTDGRQTALLLCVLKRRTSMSACRNPNPPGSLLVISATVRKNAPVKCTRP